MKKPYKGPWLFRTFLFAPGHLEKFIVKGAGSEADCVALCLEDAVPVPEKENARKCIRKTLDAGVFDNKPVFVRINSMDTGLTLLDLEAVACSQLDGFVYPMAYTPDDIKKFDAQLSLMEAQLELQKGHFSIVVLIETPRAVLKSYEIATASNRVVGLLFGCEDYMAEMESRYSIEERSLFVPRSMMAMAARAANVEPIDTPFTRVHDLEGLKRFATLGRDLGMSGMLIMSPRQIPIVRECYTPSPHEVNIAEKIVRVADEAERERRGIVIVDNTFISPPTVKQSKKLLQRMKVINSFESPGN
jgi:citrate lyase subunit beta / citryl-CoA lyase